MDIEIDLGSNDTPEYLRDPMEEGDSSETDDYSRLTRPSTPDREPPDEYKGKSLWVVAAWSISNKPPPSTNLLYAMLPEEIMDIIFKEVIQILMGWHEIGFTQGFLYEESIYKGSKVRYALHHRNTFQYRKAIMTLMQVDKYFYNYFKSNGVWKHILHAIYELEWDTTIPPEIPRNERHRLRYWLVIKAQHISKSYTNLDDIVRVCDLNRNWLTMKGITEEEQYSYFEAWRKIMQKVVHKRFVKSIPVDKYGHVHNTIGIKNGKAFIATQAELDRCIDHLKDIGDVFEAVSITPKAFHKKADFLRTINAYKKSGFGSTLQGKINSLQLQCNRAINLLAMLDKSADLSKNKRALFNADDVDLNGLERLVIKKRKTKK